MPSSTLHNKSPFEVLFNFIPEIHHLRIFGCSCYPLLRPYTHNKLQPRTTKCIFLGYASKYKGYICFEVNTKRVYISRHVLFDETEFPYSTLVPKSSSVSTILPPMQTSIPVPIPNLHNVIVHPSFESVPISSSLSVSSAPITEFVSTTTTPLNASSFSSSILPSPITATAQQSSTSLSVVPDFQGDQLQVVLSIPPLNLHPMQTRSKSGISKKIALLASVHEHGGADLTKVEPATYKSALKSPI
ncbi:hypothetical protein ACFXTI_035948 [Malus domestica]